MVCKWLPGSQIGLWQGEESIVAGTVRFGEDGYDQALSDASPVSSWYFALQYGQMATPCFSISMYTRGCMLQSGALGPGQYSGRSVPLIGMISSRGVAVSGALLMIRS